LAGRLRRTLTPLLAGLLFAALRDASDGLAVGAGSLTETVVRTAAAQLPGPGQLSTVAVAAVLGGLVGGAIARGRRQPHEAVSRLTLAGSFVGGWIGFLAWAWSWIAP
jgi:hypothetical protein